MTFEKFFTLISYLAVFCGFLSLWVSGTFGALGTALFLVLMTGAWLLEGTRWQISEKPGSVLIIFALPLFYFLWKLKYFGTSNTETLLPAILARMVLFLSAIKLLQRKSERDWIFLYLMSFFEVLLAAGLSISALYLGSFVLYLLTIVCAVIAFEMRKTAKVTASRQEPSHRFFLDKGSSDSIRVRRLPAAAAILIFFAVVAGIPLFFLLPRVGGAGFGSDQERIKNTSGFGESIKLGGIGTIQQSDAVVMRVRLDDNSALRGDTHWRGIALDTFDNQNWTRSQKATQQVVRGDRDLFLVDAASGRDELVTQTVYLEPLETPVIFGLSKVVAVQGEFPLLQRDSEGGLTVPRGTERTSYKLVSDRSVPSADRLRADNGVNSSEMANYLKLPVAGIDPRIAKLAADVTANVPDHYSKAKAVEAYLQNNFGYTLELKSHGDEPLADFLFKVKEGHCEYFATAMAIMLRTQGIATRVVNGFQQGEYNDAANVWIVRERDAHSWVEVYFQKERVWVPFDPTPFAGRTDGIATAGLFAGVNKYLEALEMYWIQYFVAFDTQEQQSLARSAQRSFVDYQTKAAIWMNVIQGRLTAWWADLRGDNGGSGSIAAVGYAVLYFGGGIVALFVFVWSCRKIVKLGVWARLWDRFRGGRRRSQVEFYERLVRILSRRGHVRQQYQTPLEFAYFIGDTGVVKLTEKYNLVRFGDRPISKDESSEIENLLRSIQNEKGPGHSC